MPPDDSGGSRGLPNEFSKIVAAAAELWLHLALGLLTVVVVGVFHRCIFAVPQLQRDVESLKSGQASILSGQVKIQSSVDECKLMVQRLCDQLGKPECALPLEACV